MDIVQQEDDWPGATRVLEEGRHAVEQPEARSLRFERRNLRQRREMLLKVGVELGDGRGARAHHRHELLRSAASNISSQELHPWPVGGGAFAFVTLRSQHLGSTNMS